MDRHLFNEGTHSRIDQRLGAHRLPSGGVRFSVWAPSATAVRVVGSFDGWGEGHALAAVAESGVWSGVVPAAEEGTVYKYRIHHGGGVFDKADPVGFRFETPPATASVVADLTYAWGDQRWMQERGERQAADRAIAIYEVHLASWRRVVEEGHRSLTYRELAPLLADYVEERGFTHVELMPVMEHPFGGSWGYQVTGYFAPTSRHGGPRDFMYFVDYLHQRGIGVILDWVPAHFPTDAHGLARFDGTYLYEHADPAKGFHPDWKSAIFNYGRHEVRSFLVSSARFWLERYHVDGLRVDGGASMLYLDYSRAEGEWIPNQFGGRENLEAIDFLRQLNETVYAEFPDVHTWAEESTDWPMVSRPTYVGGLGFGFKWDMGWMHDTLAYMSRDPIHRRYHHHQLTIRGLYANNERFVLPLSHDEVVHGKGSLLGKMPGDDWRKRANLRLLLAYQIATPGKKLLFMGGELGQIHEWNHDSSVDWHLLDVPEHRAIADLVGHLNRSYRSVPALHRLDHDPAGFEWLDANDADQSVLSFFRHDQEGSVVLCVFNLTPIPRHNHRLGVDRTGRWRELVNTDAVDYGGSGHGNLGGVATTLAGFHGRPYSLVLTLPPLGAVFLEHERS
ncbi:MAG: 1,4-alpha-glucan branching protein GlgB [Sandaracinaceae bacterium]